MLMAFHTPMSDHKNIWDSRRRKSAGSLFDRLISDEEDLDEGDVLDELSARVMSIKKNLANVLNAHLGNSASAPKLGIADFNTSTMSTNDLSVHIAHSIRKCIENYEPRVRVVSVKQNLDPDSPLQQNFRITLSTPVSNSKEQVVVEIMMREGHLAEIR